MFKPHIQQISGHSVEIPGRRRPRYAKNSLKTSIKSLSRSISKKGKERTLVFAYITSVPNFRSFGQKMTEMNRFEDLTGGEEEEEET